MKTSIIILSILALAEFVVICGMTFGGPSLANPYRYCWEFHPTVDITTYELATVIDIFGGGGGVSAPIRHYSNDSDHLFKPKPGETAGFIDRQFQRADWCDK